MQWDAVTSPVSEIRNVYVYLAAEAVIYLILALYLDAIIPAGDGMVAEHPLFFLKPLRDFCSKKKEKDLLIVPIKEEEDMKEKGEEEDADVAKEKEKVMEGDLDDCPLVLKKLRKEFDSGVFSKEKKVAVDDVYLTLEESCFGLLGINGAGKSTIMSMITGMLTPTSGECFVSGYNIVGEIDMVQKFIGVCPQFDVKQFHFLFFFFFFEMIQNCLSHFIQFHWEKILYEDLTPREHLLFYARLKGIPPSEEKEHTEKLLKQVGLLKYADNRYAKSLSGGMRRRLSFAIAFTGDPTVVLLDEPVNSFISTIFTFLISLCKQSKTTGLDPLSKRNLWACLSRLKKGKCCMISTHSMQEADSVCDKIGMIHKGKLRCIGTPLHLKRKFGRGYKFTIVDNNESPQYAKEEIEELFKNVRHLSSTKGQHVFQVDADAIQISRALAHFAQQDRNWSVSQASLEEVFEKIVQKSEDEEK